ncbi:hypothetical protein [Nocardioides sp. KR10-350]|uniref:hypothetical protein n=1 Tax=Nocardioides cheoyonin TaxID=3156615 RepID=UPI0032B3354D
MSTATPASTTFHLPGYAVRLTAVDAEAYGGIWPVRLDLNDGDGWVTRPWHALAILGGPATQAEIETLAEYVAEIYEPEYGEDGIFHASRTACRRLTVGDRGL